jgi:hypothetical protein
MTAIHPMAARRVSRRLLLLCIGSIPENVCRFQKQRGMPAQRACRPGHAARSRPLSVPGASSDVTRLSTLMLLAQSRRQHAPGLGECEVQCLVRGEAGFYSGAAAIAVGR